MVKTKEQKRQEAQQRALRSLRQRSEYLMKWVATHHHDIAQRDDENNRWEAWTIQKLRTEVAAFYIYLRDCGLHNAPGAFFIMREKILLTRYAADFFPKRHQRRCLICLQTRGQYHAAPCEQRTVVLEDDAIFIDE